MSVDWNHFTPLAALAGGALIGLSAVLFPFMAAGFATVFVTRHLIAPEQAPCYHHAMKKTMLKTALAATLAAATLAACSPKFDWRDFRSKEAPYAVMFPGKPASYSRPINLDGQEVKMTIDGTEVDGTMFYVGSAELPDAAKAAQAVQAMKDVMVRNIGGKVTKEATRNGAFEVEAHGSSNGNPMAMYGRFIAQDKRVYQVIVLGREKQINAEVVDTFLSSFKLN